MPQEIRTIRISELSSAPVPIHLHSLKQTERVSEGLEANAGEQIVRVAELRGRTYIIDGHMLVEAHRRRGRKTVRARIHRARSERDVIALHVRHNMSHPPNPVRLIRAILYMRKSGDSDVRIAEALKVNKLVADMLRFKINEDAVEELERILADVSKTYYTAHHSFPMYLVEWIFRQPWEDQCSATSALRQAVLASSGVPERKFTWPTSIEARIIQKHSQEPKSEPVRGIPLMFDNDGMRGRPRSAPVGAAVIKKSPDPEEIRKIGGGAASGQKFAFKCPHGSLLYMDGKSRVFEVEDDAKDNVVNLRHIDIEEGIYRIPKEYSDFMQVRGGRIFVKKCSPLQAKKYIARLGAKKANVCILSATEL